MLALLYVVALVAAIFYGVRVGNRQFVMPKSRNMVCLALAVSGMLTLVPMIFFAFDWFTAVLSVVGCWGWTASFVMLRQVSARIELWEKARKHAKPAPANSTAAAPARRRPF